MFITQAPRFLSRDVLILALALGGWVAPAVHPPHGIIFGGTGLPQGDLYWINLYVGAGGFFSRAVVLENTWEQTHGHTWPIGLWIGGYLVGLSVPLSAATVILIPRWRLWVAAGWPVIALWLTGTWLQAFTSLSQFGWRTHVLLAIYGAYSLFLCHLWWSGTSRLGRAQGIYLAARSSPLFYPTWLLGLILTQGHYPFVGCWLTLGGCILLALRPHEVQYSQNP